VALKNKVVKGTCEARRDRRREKWYWLRLENLRMVITLQSAVFLDISDHPNGCSAFLNSFCKNLASLAKLLQLKL